VEEQCEWGERCEESGGINRSKADFRPPEQTTDERGNTVCAFPYATQVTHYAPTGNDYTTRSPPRQPFAGKNVLFARERLHASVLAVRATPRLERTYNMGLSDDLTRV
jgi:hypothetical protein